jgi:hypothetical protein
MVYTSNFKNISLYGGGEFDRSRKRAPLVEETTDLPQVTYKIACTMLYA